MCTERRGYFYGDNEYFIIGIKAIFGKKKGVKVSKENKKLSMYIIGTSTL